MSNKRIEFAKLHEDDDFLEKEMEFTWIDQGTLYYRHIDGDLEIYAHVTEYRLGDIEYNSVETLGHLLSEAGDIYITVDGDVVLNTH